MKPLLIQPDQQYGSLTTKQRVVGAAPKGERKPVSWWTLCACGREKLIAENAIRRGSTTSCGCQIRERMTLEGFQAAIRLYFRQCKAQAKRAGRIWELTLEQFTEIVLQDCKYCIRPKTRRIGRKRKGTSEYYHPTLLVSGIDRRDNNLGYLAIPDQCVPCHTDCNSSKSDDTVEVFGARRTKAMQKEIAKLVRRGIVVEVSALPG